MSYEFQDQVLGMVVSQPKRYWPEVKNKWNPEVFLEIDRIKLATALQELLNSDVEFNVSVLREHLQGHACIMLLQPISGYIREANIVWFLDQLIIWNNFRKLTNELADISNQIFRSKNTDKPDHIVTQLKKVYERSEQCISGTIKFNEMKDMLESTLSRIENRILLRKNGQIRGYSMGLKTLDDIMQGFIPGRFYIIAARTSVGKTSFASFITYKAIKQGASPLFFSNEMDKEDLIEKFISCEGKLSTQKFQVGDLNDDENTKLAQAVNELAKFKSVVDEKNGWDLDTLISTVHQLYRKKKCDLVIVDYLQQVRVPSAKSKYEQVSIVSDEMKKLSRELNIPVIGLAQINREVEKGMVKELPGLANLKDSGSLEQDADVVMILHKEKLTDELVTLNVAKNRYGPTGLIKMRHQHKFNTYEGT